VPTGKLDASMDARMSMAEFCRRSLLHEYHSLTDDWMVAGSPAMDGWASAGLMARPTVAAVVTPRTAARVRRKSFRGTGHPWVSRRWGKRAPLSEASSVIDAWVHKVTSLIVKLRSEEPAESGVSSIDCAASRIRVCAAQGMGGRRAEKESSTV
jgi:hypothetical protein